MTLINGNFSGKPSFMKRVCQTTRLCAGLVLTTLAFGVAAETAYYYDGSVQRKMTLQPDLIANFAANVQPKSRSTSPISAPFVTITNNASASRTAGTVANQSPVFRNGDSPAGQLMALPGGVIVNFKPEWTDEQIRLWASGHSYTINSKLNILGNWYVIDTPAGTAALQIANDIHESGEVVSASPNWWKQIQGR